MNKDTINAIAVLLTLFTEEEKEGLKITSGTREITLRDQFIGRWFSCTPLYTGTVFLAKAAALIDGHRYLFARVIELNKPDNKKQLTTYLSDPNSFIATKETVTTHRGESKSLNIGETATRGISREAGKSRGGSSEYGEEFIELDKVWDRQDNDYLGSGLEQNRVSASINVDATKKGLEGVDVNIRTNQPPQGANEAPGSFGTISTDISLEANEPALQSINTTQHRSKAISEGHSDSLGFGQANTHTDGTSKSKYFILLDSIRAMTSAHIKDPRETAFQKLDVLFSDPCQ